MCTLLAAAQVECAIPSACSTTSAHHQPATMAACTRTSPPKVPAAQQIKHGVVDALAAVTPCSASTNDINLLLKLLHMQPLYTCCCCAIIVSMRRLQNRRSRPANHCQSERRPYDEPNMYFAQTFARHRLGSIHYDALPVPHHQYRWRCRPEDWWGRRPKSTTDWQRLHQCAERTNFDP